MIYSLIKRSCATLTHSALDIPSWSEVSHGAFIETLQQALATGTMPDRISVAAGLAKDQSDTIVQLLQEGKKIEAIKVYRQATGAGLKAAALPRIVVCPVLAVGR
jgi:hypothetical protein